MQSSSSPGNSSKVTSGNNPTYWLDSVEQKSFQSLSENIETDVLIVGAGIAGITTAYCLAKAGKQVTIIEAVLPGYGETGRTTAHVVNALDDRYFDIAKMHGEEPAKLVAESHTAAIAFIESAVKERSIECDFRRLDGYLFLHFSDKKKTLEDELDATQKAGIKTEMVQNVPGIEFEAGPSLRFPSQAQFHPMKYVNALIDFIIDNGGKIYTHTRAEKFEKNTVSTIDGFTIAANQIVVATNSPVSNKYALQTSQYPYRTYVVGGLMPKEKTEPALWWDTGDQDSKWVSKPYHYARLQNYDEQNNLLIVGGEDHKTGQADAEDISQEERYAKLEQWARLRFPSMKEIIYKWSGQVLEPVDSLAFIGRNPGDENVYVITGDSGNGITHGTIGGMLVSDIILGKENSWEKIYNPARITLKAAGEFLQEAGNMAIQYIDFLKAGDIQSQNELSKGEGAVMNVGLHKVAVYKNEHGNLNAYTAVCPHLGCVVQWNADEKTFDCPCHGSRFTHEGEVINGPAVHGLKKFDIAE